eukprot:1144594-Pelagomonas_calceolata.AAC.5
MAVPEQLMAAERTLEAMGREIRMAECIALTHPIEPKMGRLCLNSARPDCLRIGLYYSASHTCL